MDYVAFIDEEPDQKGLAQAGFKRSWKVGQCIEWETE